MLLSCICRATKGPNDLQEQMVSAAAFCIIRSSLFLSGWKAFASPACSVKCAWSRFIYVYRVVSAEHVTAAPFSCRAERLSSSFLALLAYHISTVVQLLIQDSLPSNHSHSPPRIRLSSPTSTQPIKATIEIPSEQSAAVRNGTGDSATAPVTKVKVQFPRDSGQNQLDRPLRLGQIPPPRRMDRLRRRHNGRDSRDRRPRRR